MVRHVRFHGRGGEGVKLASRIVSRAAFLSGFVVQDSPLYGAERRGAPVVAFVRVSTAPILERGYIDTPDVAVVIDSTLLIHPEAAVLEGLRPATVVLANTAASAETLRARHGLPGTVITMDVSSLVLDVLGQHLLSAPMAGFTVKAMNLTAWETVAMAVHVELSELGVSPDTIDRNVAVARRAFEQAPSVTISEPERLPPMPRTAGFVVPRLAARVAAPSITVEATSALRRTGDWRVCRPSISLDLCTRCFMCFALCPEGAIRLDAESFPHIDYDHCKGCLVCATECPPQAISYDREETA